MQFVSLQTYCLSLMLSTTTTTTTKFNLFMIDMFILMSTVV